VEEPVIVAFKPLLQVKRRRNTTVGVSSVIVGHETAATLVRLQALLAYTAHVGFALSSFRRAREYHRTVKKKKSRRELHRISRD